MDQTEAVQPFEASLLHPNRRATLFSGEKVNRSTYTQSDSSSLGVISNAAGENFLAAVLKLRRAAVAFAGQSRSERAGGVWLYFPNPTVIDY